ncbi:MAG: hypothetical protein D8M54_11650 [Chloroflexi bacterium]|nr:hypothetical protein [Chloroflexota bacterium]
MGISLYLQITNHELRITLERVEDIVMISVSRCHGTAVTTQSGNFRDVVLYATRRLAATQKKAAINNPVDSGFSMDKTVQFV